MTGDSEDVVVMALRLIETAAERETGVNIAALGRRTSSLNFSVLGRRFTVSVMPLTGRNVIYSVMTSQWHVEAEVAVHLTMDDRLLRLRTVDILNREAFESDLVLLKMSEDMA